jgi:hypothetical protein
MHDDAMKQTTGVAARTESRCNMYPRTDDPNPKADLAKNSRRELTVTEPLQPVLSMFLISSVLINIDKFVEIKDRQA